VPLSPRCVMPPRPGISPLVVTSCFLAQEYSYPSWRHPLSLWNIPPRPAHPLRGPETASISYLRLIVITTIFVPFKIIRGSSAISVFPTMYFKINWASNAFALWAKQIIYLKHFIIRIAKSTNCFTESCRNVNSRTPYRRHRTDILFRARFANLLRDAKCRNVNFYGPFERLVLSCFKIIKHEYDAIFSATVLAYDFTLTCTHLFLHCRGTRTLSRNFNCDFTLRSRMKQEWFAASNEKRLTEYNVAS